MLLDLDDKRWIKKVCQKHVSTIRDIYKIKESTWNRVYHVLTSDQLFLCKVGPLLSGVTNEYHALSFLLAKGIRFVPEVICYWEGKGRAFLVTRFIQNSGHYKVGRLGENFAQIHSLKHHKDTCEDFVLRLIIGKENELSDLKYLWGKVNPKRIRLLNQVGDILKRMNSLYKKKKRFFMKERARFIHMDAHDAVIPNQHEMYLVDWHMACYGDPASDLARLCEYEHQRTPHFDQDDFIQAYSGGKELAESMIWKMSYYNLASRVALLLYSFGDCANLVRYRSSPLVVVGREEELLVKLLDNKIAENLQKIQLDFERLSA